MLDGSVRVIVIGGEKIAPEGPKLKRGERTVPGRLRCGGLGSVATLMEVTGAPARVAVTPGPMVTVNQAIAVAMVDGPRAGLDLLAGLDGDDRVAGHHRLAATRAHLLEMAGDEAAARAAYLEAARRTTSLPEQRYLESRAARLVGRTTP